MRLYVTVLFSLLAFRASAASEAEARLALHQALESQAFLPDTRPRLPTASDPHFARDAAHQTAALARARQSFHNVANESAHTSDARRVADRAVATTGDAVAEKAATAPGQVRAADVREYGNVRGQGNSASVGNGNGQGNSNAGGNGKGKGKGKGNGNGN